MVMMKNSVIMATCLLLLSSLALQTYASTFGPDKCCFKFVPKPVSKRAVVSFRFTDSLCPMEGVLLTLKNKEVCADMSQQWVKDLIKAMEKKQTTGVINSTTIPSQ